MFLFISFHFICFICLFIWFHLKRNNIGTSKCIALSILLIAMSCPQGWWSLWSYPWIVVTLEQPINRRFRLYLSCAQPLPDSISGNCLSSVTLLLSWRLAGTVTSNDTAQRVLVRTINTSMSLCRLSEPLAPESGYL